MMARDSQQVHILFDRLHVGGGGSVSTVSVSPTLAVMTGFSGWEVTRRATVSTV